MVGESRAGSGRSAARTVVLPATRGSCRHLFAALTGTASIPECLSISWQQRSNDVSSADRFDGAGCALVLTAAARLMRR